MEPILPMPRLLKLDELLNVGFYDFYSSKNCIFKGCRKNSKFDGSMPIEFQNERTLVGLFYHDCMELGYKANSIEELKAEIEELIAQYQIKVSSNSNLRKMGSFSNWRDVNFASRRVCEVYRTRKNNEDTVDIRSEDFLKSACGSFVGRLDQYKITSNIAKLLELKSSEIRDINGEIKNEYREQILFYSFLLFQNFEIQSVKAILESMSGDVIEFEISKSESKTYYEKCIKELTDMNIKIKNLKITDELEQITNSTKDNCTYCNKKIVCNSFKQKQLNLNLEGSSYVLHGNIIKIDKQALNADTIEFFDVNLDKIIKIRCDKSIAQHIDENSKKVFYGASFNAGIFIINSRTQIFYE